MQSIELLALVDDKSDVLNALALNESSQSIRSAAITALSRRSESDTWRKLLAQFPSESPAIRRAIINGVLARTNRTTWLLDEIEAERIKVSELDQSRTNRLLKHRDAAIAKRAKSLLASAITADRKKVLADYQVVLKMKSDPHRGLAVFKTNCATCHRVADIGVDVAPDISDSRTKKPAQILTDIIQPNRAIDTNYIGYMVVTTDGRVLTGILTAETATSVTLKQAEGKSLTLLRDEIDEMRSTGMSLMPVGLEQKIPHQDMADLISFVKNWRYLDGKTPYTK